MDDPVTPWMKRENEIAKNQANLRAEFEVILDDFLEKHQQLRNEHTETRPLQNWYDKYPPRKVISLFPIHKKRAKYK